MSRNKLVGSSSSRVQRPSYSESANFYASGIYSAGESRRINDFESANVYVSGVYSGGEVSLGHISKIGSSLSPTALSNVASIRRKYMTIKSLIGHPICCGYLLQFCQSEYNAESLNFVLEVDELRDTFAADNLAWQHDWKELDDQVIAFEEKNGFRVVEGVDFGDTDNIPGKILKEGLWPSITDKSSSIDRVESILQKYLSPDSATQVCISELLIRRTMKRIGLLHLYGPEVFEEACLEPIQTMRKDILPRFLISEVADRMIVNVASCEPKTPAAVHLKVPPPDSRLLTLSPLESFCADRNFTLDEILSSLQLYNEFLIFLQKSLSSENLICVRMVTIFEDHMIKLDLKEAGTQAWKIYQYFVAPGSAYEVSIHHLHRKHIMLGMAEPKKSLFGQLKRSATEMLKANFEVFIQNEQYKKLWILMRQHKIELNSISKPSSFGCFAFGSSNVKK